MAAVGLARSLNNLDRRTFIGARIIMGQDETALIRLWREKRVGTEDLSGELIVQLGLATEDLNRQWYEHNTSRAVTDLQSRVVHPRAIRWMAATLDGVAAGSEVYGFFRARLRSLTPSPPPFSSMNSMPAFSRAASILAPVSVRPPNVPSWASRRLIVGTDTAAAKASCSCDQSNSARAALICLIDTFSIDFSVILVDTFSINDGHTQS